MGRRESRCGGWEARRLRSLGWKLRKNRPQCWQETAESLCPKEATLSGVTLNRAIPEGSLAGAHSSQGRRAAWAPRPVIPSCWGQVPWPQRP